MRGGSASALLTHWLWSWGTQASEALAVKGVSMGGEYGTSATYMAEMASRHNRGFWSGIFYTTLIAGQLLATGTLIALQALLSPEDLQAWGWRIPFFVGAALGNLAGPWVAGWVFDRTGSYTPVIWGCLALAALATAAAWRLKGDPPPPAPLNAAAAPVTPLRA